MDECNDVVLQGGVWTELNSLLENLTDNRLADVSRNIDFIPERATVRISICG